MAWPESLTAGQQAVVENWQALQAAWCIKQAQANDLGQQVDAAYNAVVLGLSIPSADVIPLTVNYAGAQAMIYSDCVTIESHIQNIATTWNTAAVRQLWSKACGAGNL